MIHPMSPTFRTTSLVPTFSMYLGTHTTATLENREMIFDRHWREGQPSHTPPLYVQQTYVSIQVAGLRYNHTSLRQHPIEPYAVNPTKVSRPKTSRESLALFESYVPARCIDE